MKNTGLRQSLRSIFCKCIIFPREHMGILAERAVKPLPLQKCLLEFCWIYRIRNPDIPTSIIRLKKKLRNNAEIFTQCGLIAKRTTTQQSSNKAY